MTAALLLGAAGAVVVWYVDLRRRPMKLCPVCKGNRKLPGAIMAGTFGYCHRCGGKGEVRRIGAGREG